MLKHLTVQQQLPLGLHYERLTLQGWILINLAAKTILIWNCTDWSEK